MWSTPCQHEESVRRMVRAERDDAALRAHAMACDDCRDAIEVAESIRELASMPLPASSPTPPSASYLWWKAELLRRWDAEQRAVEPVDMGERIGAGLGVVGAAAILLWFWRRVDFALPAFLRGDDTGLTVWWLVAATAVFCLLAVGATAMALLAADGHDRKG